MIPLTDQAIVVREICNGIMAISSLILIGVFVNYIVEKCRVIPYCYNDLGVQAAAAIVVLMIGHAIRAISSWLEFLWARFQWPEGPWTNTLAVFIAATAFTLAGKILVAYAFSPDRWKWLLAGFIAATAIGIPLTVAFFT